MMKLSCCLITAILVVVCSGTAAAQRLAVAVDVANIRSGPGTKFDILWKIGKFHPINVIDTSGPWYHFRDFEGDEGWIHKSLTGKIPAVITAKDKCNIRSGPGTNFKILFSVEKGIPFKIINFKGNWIHIQHADGDQGWVHKSMVW